jgi:hypothetical protein
LEYGIIRDKGCQFHPEFYNGALKGDENPSAELFYTSNAKFESFATHLETLQIGKKLIW